jgi:hypothetical protein
LARELIHVLSAARSVERKLVKMSVTADCLIYEAKQDKRGHRLEGARFCRAES